MRVAVTGAAGRLGRALVTALGEAPYTGPGGPLAWGRAEFDLDRLRTGFMRALHKRPVPTQLVDEAIATVTQDVLALGEREIQSRRIGEMVMRELRRLDQVAYIRFASVYRSFEGVDDFEDAIKEVQRPSKDK